MLILRLGYLAFRRSMDYEPSGSMHIGIPEFMPLIRRRICKVNLYAPGRRTRHRTMKVWRTHWAYLITCRLSGGGFVK